MNSQEPTDDELEAWHLSQIKQRPTHLQAKPIRTVMRRLMSERGYAAIQATASLNEVWAVAVGVLLAKSTRPGKITRGTLNVAVSDSGVIQELHFHKREILAALKSHLPECKISDLRLYIES
jgi:Dna[CI] antecedent, DciA